MLLNPINHSANVKLNLAAIKSSKINGTNTKTENTPRWLAP
jgi:hypothetical protein